MTSSPRDRAVEGSRLRPLLRMSEMPCWACFGRGRVGRGGRRRCHNCDGTGRDWTIVPAFADGIGLRRVDKVARSS